MFEGFLRVGSNEIVNSARTLGYTRTADCPINWLKCPPCDGVRDAVEDVRPYIYANIADAPWYDLEDEPTHRFLGVHALTVEGITDSTRTAEVAEGILDGGVVGQVRNATRRVRVQAILSADGEDALEAGFAWLEVALRPRECGIHGTGCGSTDSSFFAACPAERSDYASDEAHQAAVDRLYRSMHNVTCVAGPTVEQKLHRGRAWGYVVEFVLVAATPWVFGITRSIEILPTTPVVVQDVPFNLVPYPSAELASGTVLAATNYSTNPSVEVDTVTWAKGSTVVVAGDVVGSRSSTLAAVGGWSYRSRFTASNTGSNGTITAENTSGTFAATTAGQRMSVNMWASAAVASGTAVIQKTEVFAIWRATSSVLRTDLVGTITGAGAAALTGRAIAVPVGANNVIMQAKTTLTSWSTGAVVDLHSDAVAVTVP